MKKMGYDNDRVLSHLCANITTMYGDGFL